MSLAGWLWLKLAGHLQGSAHFITPLEALQYAAREDSEQEIVSSRRLLNDVHSYPDRDSRYVQQLEKSYCGDNPPPDKMVVGKSLCKPVTHGLSAHQTPPTDWSVAAAVAASHFDLAFLDKMGLAYVAYQHHDPTAPYWYELHICTYCCLQGPHHPLACKVNRPGILNKTTR